MESISKVNGIVHDDMQQDIGFDADTLSAVLVTGMVKQRVAASFVESRCLQRELLVTF